ncbi:hypothetical protein [Sphingobacterium sp. ML3W]|uniref:hypothetical protein n=1 Tax=Sphingobacterium sp. ML3W TaxID=1538644 RepID=UPI000689F6A8|nr:hypothetical protein [Sphingobacterium sp. ML3W]
MSSILKRIKLVADHEGRSVSAFEATIGASKGVFTRALTNGTDIQSKWLISLMENYPDYSAEWLLRGEGEMLKPKPIVVEGSETYLNAELDGVSNAVIHALQQVVSTQNVTIKSQEKIIFFMERQLSVYESELDTLKKK